MYLSKSLGYDFFFGWSFETLNKLHVSNNSLYEFGPESFYFLHQMLLPLFGSNFPVLLHYLLSLDVLL